MFAPRPAIQALVLLCILSTLTESRAQSVPHPNPIVFVTQVPVPADFTTIGSTFGNHLSSLFSAARGGDLMIRYPDGTMKNITQLTGFGSSGMQGSNAIAVRDPSPHWSGQKILFSMVVGAPTQQYQVQSYRWQIYEATNLGQNETPQVSLVLNQPANFNNITPVYMSDGRILFSSDRPRDGAAHLYPQLDEYEEAPTVSGLWTLDPANGDLKLMTHAPSGTFTPSIDSFGRVIFTQWDHLQRDQQADADATSANPPYGTFDYSSEGASSVPTSNRVEVFPEPRAYRTDLLAGTNLEGHSFNHFFPWMMNQDGSEIETLNHVGRHELHSYFNRSVNGLTGIFEFIAANSNRLNTVSMENFFQIEEDPNNPGRYIGVDAAEFGTHAAGKIVSLSLPPGMNPDLVAVTELTHPETRNSSTTPTANHSGLFRDPLPLSDGSLLAVHSGSTLSDQNIGTTLMPQSRYSFLIKAMVAGPGGYLVPGGALTGGITKSISYWDPDQLVTYNGPLWELSPVELRVRSQPPMTTKPAALESPEQLAFDAAGIDRAAIEAFLTQNDLALVVSRNVTTRDTADRQQPFNLRVQGTTTETSNGVGQVHDISDMQFFQADLLRGLGGTTNPRAGRRVLARPMHDDQGFNPQMLGAAEGSVRLGLDGSMAAFVPAQRALSWQLTDPQGNAVVRERYWLSFQPGEIRVCASCHGINSTDQIGGLVPTNTPQALTDLLIDWQAQTGPTIDQVLGSGDVAASLGGPYDVLKLNGSSGGYGRRVDLSPGQPFTIAMDLPPSRTTPADFVIWGLVGPATVQTAYPSSEGTFAIWPHLAAPGHPALFTLANTYYNDPWSLLPATQAPWSITAPFGLPPQSIYSFQGVLNDGVNPNDPYSRTNALILRVE